MVVELNRKTLLGVYTALATPFLEDSKSIDRESLKRLISFQLSAGVSGLVIAGSTGEAATLNDEEYQQLVEYSVGEVKGRCPVIAGINANNTERGVMLAQMAERAGADGILLVVPFYNKPSQDGIIAHFRAIKDAISLPIVAYNVPGRTVTNMLPATVAKLAEENLIVGLKDATGSMDQMLETVRLCGDKIAILSGEDSLLYSCLAVSGKGMISATANVIPEVFVSIHKNFMMGNLKDALAAQLKVLPIVNAMFLESNPVPVKAALMLKGIIKSDSVRLPLLPAQDRTIQALKEIFQS
jgi:4-hydroxy-tetrahydrodipicolinate synthase